MKKHYKLKNKYKQFNKDKNLVKTNTILTYMTIILAIINITDEDIEQYKENLIEKYKTEE